MCIVCVCMCGGTCVQLCVHWLLEAQRWCQESSLIILPLYTLSQGLSIKPLELAGAASLDRKLAHLGESPISIFWGWSYRWHCAHVEDLNSGPLPSFSPVTALIVTFFWYLGINPTWSWCFILVIYIWVQCSEESWSVFSLSVPSLFLFIYLDNCFRAMEPHETTKGFLVPVFLGGFCFPERPFLV